MRTVAANVMKPHISIADASGLLCFDAATIVVGASPPGNSNDPNADSDRQNPATLSYRCSHHRRPLQSKVRCLVKLIHE